MTDESVKTDGNAATVTATETPAEKTATSTASDTAVKTGRDERIDGLTAQNKRKDEQLEKLASELTAIKEQNKSDQEKLLDAHAKDAVEKFKAETHEPQKQRLEGLEATLTEEYERESAELSDEQKALIDADSNVEKRVAQVRRLKALMSGKPTSIGATVNPQGDAPRGQVKRSELVAWQNAASEDREHYEKLKDAMHSAVREGRIVED